MHLLNLLSLALCTASSATAMKVFVGSGGGQITTLEISDTDGTVKELSSVLNSAPSPNWQEISHDGKILYTTEESTVSNSSLGAITSYGIDATGALTKITSSSAPAGPVSISVSPNGTTIFSAS